MRRILFLCHGNICRSPMAEFILKALVRSRFDRIICMDQSNLRLLRRIIPSDPEGKIHLMMSYTGSGRDVADPWYTGDFETTFQDLLEACEAMLDMPFRS